MEEFPADRRIFRPMEPLGSAAQMTERTNRDEMAACLRAARAYIRADQKDVGERLGISAETVSAWERERYRIPAIAHPAIVEGLVDLGAPRRLFETGKETR